MFRSALVRAVQLPRAAAASGAVVAGIRVAIPRSSGLVKSLAFERAVSSVPAVVRLRRDYSSSTVAAAEAKAEAAEAAVEAAVEAENNEAPGLITRFQDLERVGVHSNLIRALTQRLKYDKMTPVQSMTIQPALQGKDVVAQAKTGTGKTLAFLIPTVQRMLNDNPELAYYDPKRRARGTDIRAIIISPTRELAEQIGAEARNLVRDTGIVVQTAVGGTQKRQMLMHTRQKGCHLLVATPGRLNDILEDPDSGIAAPDLSALVLDEADRMLDVGFADELQEIVYKLPKRAKVPRQTLLFSATVPKNVVSLARSYIDPKNFQFVQTVNPDEALTHERIPQFVVPVNGYENIYPTILEIIRRGVTASRTTDNDALPFKAIIFLPTTLYVQLTTRVFHELRSAGYRLPMFFEIHSKLTQNRRTQSAERFRAAKSGILISSDVTARGMDFPNVTHVIQVGIPPSREQYIHRLGRTGRAHRGGEGWLIVTKQDLPIAREKLTSLPLQNATDLDCANFDFANDDARPDHVDDVGQALARMPRDLLSQVYFSHFGGMAHGQHDQITLNSLNQWVKHGWGWDEPPYIFRRNAAMRGLLKLRGLNVREERGAHGGERGQGARRSGTRAADQLGDTVDPRDFEAALTQSGEFGAPSRSRSGRPGRYERSDRSNSRGRWGDDDGFSNDRQASRNSYGNDRRGSRGGFGSDRRGSRNGFGSDRRGSRSDFASSRHDTD